MGGVAGIGWVDVTALGHQRHVTAASVAGAHACETAEPGRQSRCRLAPSNPLKTKLDGWGGRHWLGWRNGSGQHREHQPLQRHVTAASVAGERACETAEPQQDSGPTGCHLVGRAAAVWHLRTRWKTKLDGRGWKTKLDGWGSSMWRWLDGANRPWLPEHGGWMDVPLLMEGAS